MVLGTYTLMTVGVNVKRWSLRKNESMYAFRSTYLPLGFALADSENGTGYRRLVSTVMETAQTLGLEFRPSSILQWRGDMHKGIENARQLLAPGSTRVSDWAHVVGGHA